MGRIRERVVGHVLLAALVLAGCTDAPSSPANDPEALVSHPLIHSGCSLDFGIFPLRPGQAERLLPPGFVPYSADFDQPVSGLQVVAWECTDIQQGATSRRGPGREIWWLVEVAPPERYRAPDAEFHWVFLGVMLDTPELVDAFRAWGSGEGSLAIFTSDRSLQVDGAGLARLAGKTEATTLRLATTTGGERVPDPPHLVRAYVTSPDKPEVVGALDIALDEIHFLAGAADFAVEGDASRFPEPRGEGIGFRGAEVGFTMTSAPEAFS